MEEIVSASISHEYSEQCNGSTTSYNGTTRVNLIEDATPNPETQPGSNSGSSVTASAQNTGRKTNQLNFLRTNVMKNLFRHEESLYFRKPVDSSKLLNYDKFIKYPVDLGTIRSRLNKQCYQSAAECLRDFQVMFCNCYIYNAPDSFIVKEARKLEMRFLVKLNEMPEVETDVVETNNLASVGDDFLKGIPSRRSSRSNVPIDSSDEETENISKKERKKRRMDKIDQQMKKLQQELFELANDDEVTGSDSDSEIQTNKPKRRKKQEFCSGKPVKENSLRKSTSMKYKSRCESLDGSANDTQTSAVGISHDKRKAPIPAVVTSEDKDSLERDLCNLSNSDLVIVIHTMTKYKDVNRTVVNYSDDVLNFDGLESHQFWEVRDLISSMMKKATNFARSPPASATFIDADYSKPLPTKPAISATNIPINNGAATVHTQPENELGESDEDDGLNEILNEY